MAEPHIPVLLKPLLRAVDPVSGIWVDGTFGAGGYARGLLEAGADQVIGIDRDPSVFRMAEGWAADHGDRLRMVEGTFSDLDALAGEPVDGVVLDLGVSSMQLDQAERGFSFLRDGPLDMRMGESGPSAADLLNSAEDAVIADALSNGRLQLGLGSGLEDWAFGPFGIDWDDRLRVYADKVARLRSVLDGDDLGGGRTLYPPSGDLRKRLWRVAS